jgi:hypothetical protein
MATTTHIQQSGARRRGITLLVLLLSVAGGSFAGTTALPAGSSSAASAGTTASSRPYSYGWPVKPFDRQHPVRDYFGDPRSVFDGDPTMRGLMTSRCACSLHQGIDISVPDGTAVYPVRSGLVRIVTTHWVEVDSDDGVGFQYWHIKPLVAVGDHVSARETVLGHTQKGMQHVHLTQLQDNHAVNPLAAGNLGPYEDATVPQVNRIDFRAGDTGPELLPEYLHGRIEIVVDASDTPAIPVPGVWRGLSNAPAKLTYRIERLPHRRTVRTGTAMDVTRTLPSTPDMWHTYARGSHMNMVKIGSHRYWFQPGAYLFKLTSAAFDTRTLRDGAFAVTVTAWDTAGNHSSTTQIFSVHNRATWLP